MNRSFICGIIVASTTWCFSLYLYWLLTQNPSTDLRNSMEKWSPSPDAKHQVDQYLDKGKHKTFHQNELSYEEKQRKNDEQKDYLYRKHKKETKFRKISQKLIDELKPMEVKGGTGMKNVIFFFFLLIFLLF